MKILRIELGEGEYGQLREEAGRLGVSVRQLVHDRAVATDSDGAILGSAKIMADEIARCREAINDVIRYEMGASPRLYEADIIRLENSICKIEGIVAAFIGEALRQVRKNNGNS